MPLRVLAQLPAERVNRSAPATAEHAQDSLSHPFSTLFLTEQLPQLRGHGLAGAPSAVSASSSLALAHLARPQGPYTTTTSRNHLDTCTGTPPILLRERKPRRSCASRAGCRWPHGGGRRPPPGLARGRAQTTRRRPRRPRAAKRLPSESRSLWALQQSAAPCSAPSPAPCSRLQQDWITVAAAISATACKRAALLESARHESTREGAAARDRHPTVWPSAFCRTVTCCWQFRDHVLHVASAM